jgi:hypothetical protein
MTGYPRLRLAQDFGEVGDGQFGLGEESQDAQARALPGRFEGGVKRIEGQVGRWSHRGIFPNGAWTLGRKFAGPHTAASHIKISLYGKMVFGKPVGKAQTVAPVGSRRARSVPVFQAPRELA